MNASQVYGYGLYLQFTAGPARQSRDYYLAWIQRAGLLSPCKRKMTKIPISTELEPSNRIMEQPTKSRSLPLIMRLSN